MAKGLGGGLPIGAFMCGEKCADVLTAGQHGTTFGGNPVVAAGGLEVMKRVTNDNFLHDVICKGEYIRRRISEMNLPIVKDIRGKGLMIGIQLDGSPKDYSKKAVENGLLILTAGKDVIRFLPPLTISYAEIDEGLKIFERIMH